MSLVDTQWSWSGSLDPEYTCVNPIPGLLSTACTRKVHINFCASMVPQRNFIYSSSSSVRSAQPTFISVPPLIVWSYSKLCAVIRSYRILFLCIFPQTFMIYLHHHHHLSRSCHCWQMASTTCAMHFDPGPFSSIDCQRLPRCHLSISFWVFLLVVFHLWVSTLMLFSPTWCSSFWLHVLPTVLSCTSLFLLYRSPLFSILLSRSWSCLSLWCSITISPCSVGLQQASSLDVLLKSMSLIYLCYH